MTNCKNFANWLFETNITNRDKLAFVDNNQSLTYGQLENHVKMFATQLVEAKLLPQQRIIICLEDCVEWPVFFLASLMVGLNPVLVSADLPKKTIEHVIDLCDCSAIVTKEFVDFGLKQFTKNQALQLGPKIDQIYQYHPDEPCFWLLSSGTTGEPKCLVHRHEDLPRLLELVAAPAYGLDSDSRILSTAKLSFTYGFNNAITFALGKGATTYLINGVPAPSVIFEKITQHQITHFFTVPTIISSMLKHGQNKKLDSCVKFMASSGEPLPVGICERFEQQHSITIYNCIGMSEVTQTCCAQTPKNYEPGTVGSPLPGVECQVRDRDGTVLPVGQMGELYVKSPCAALMYWKDWKKTKATFVGEWVRTGDNVIQTAKGNYIYVSRADDLIKINGLYVSAIEVESAVMELDGVADCAVVVNNDDELPEIHAFVVKDLDLNSSDILVGLKSRLERHKIPKKIHFIDSLPKTVTFKKQRFKLRDLVC
jgi:benzoate-CoA ligase